jgi:hypothetical protein
MNNPYELFVTGSNNQWRYRLVTPEGSASHANGKIISGDPDQLVLYAIANAASTIPNGSTVKIILPLFKLKDTAKKFTAPAPVSVLAFTPMSADRRAQWQETLRHLDGITSTWHAVAENNTVYQNWGQA